MCSKFIDYAINENDIAIIVDYTNTTDDNVSPAWQIGINVFQDGIEMNTGSSFEIEGVRDSFTEIRPGTKIRVAEFFELDNNNPIEVEFSQLLSFDGKEPLYIEIDLDTNKITSKGGEEIGTGGKLFGGIWGKVYDEAMGQYQDAYNQAMSEYSNAYDQAMDEYQNAYDDAMQEYNNAVSDVLGQLGF